MIRFALFALALLAIGCAKKPKVSMPEPSDPVMYDIEDTETKVTNAVGPSRSFVDLKPSESDLILFALNSSEVVKDIDPPLGAIGAYVTGHACQLGTEAYNMDLSKRRAESVRDYLANRGMDPKRIKLYWKGESEPIPGSLDASRRAQIVWSF
jgi:outer membrane protein OmpA-like peptidoglycan-associated protein